jgi:hypothetical protein
MTEKTPELVQASSHLLPMAGTFLVTVGTFLAGFVPYIQWREKKQKIKADQEKAVIEEENRKKPKYLEIAEFKNIMDPFAASNEMAHSEVKKRLSEAMLEFGNTQLAVSKVSSEVAEMKTSVAVLETKVDLLPDAISDKLLVKIYHINPGEKESA